MTDLPQSLEEAQAYELGIAERAAKIREGTDGMSHELFLELWPLLREPIPPAYIQRIGITKGKPYVSTGISSVQVQMDRMDNVLTPLWWWYEDEYFLEGKLCAVKVFVGDHIDGPILIRSSRGGVTQGSTVGNIHKGSFTNAAKPAFARIGPGHEIYIGVADFDPDVSRDLAEAAPPKSDGTIGKPIAKKIVDRAWTAGEKDRLRLAATKLVGHDIGDCGTKAKAADALAGSLTFEQADKLDEWLQEQQEKRGGSE